MLAAGRRQRPGQAGLPPAAAAGALALQANARRLGAAAIASAAAAGLGRRLRVSRVLRHRGALMLRAVVVALLVANLVFFAWARGWLAPGLPAPRQSDHEPQRLAAQHRPELVSVLAPTAASAAVSAARAAAAVCLEAGPFASTDAAGNQVGAAEAVLVQAQLPAGTWLREAAPPPPLWVVFAGRWPDAPARGARVEELRKRGLEFELIDGPADLAPGLVLSRHPDRAAADAAQAALVAPAASQPLRNLRVVELPAPPLRHWLRVPRASAEQRARLALLPAAALAALGGGFKPCVGRS